jgi:hypothetical protein
VTINIKQHDTKGKFVDILMLNGAPIDLTSCIVSFLMKKTGNAIKQLATITDAATGAVEYQPTADDVSNYGEFQQEWEIIFPDGEILTVPNGRYNTVNILKDLG